MNHPQPPAPTAEAATGELFDAAGRRVAALRRAAQAERDQATARAEAGLQHLIKNGEPITFRTLARTAGVSLDFLYTHPDLRTRIQTLRDHTRALEQHGIEP